MKKAFMSIAIAVAAIAMVSCGNKGAEGAGAGTDKAEPEGKQLTFRRQSGSPQICSPDSRHCPA